MAAKPKKKDTSDRAMVTEIIDKMLDGENSMMPSHELHVWLAKRIGLSVEDLKTLIRARYAFAGYDGDPYVSTLPQEG